jgi:hypothetical protein
MVPNFSSYYHSYTISNAAYAHEWRLPEQDDGIRLCSGLPAPAAAHHVFDVDTNHYSSNTIVGAAFQTSSDPAPHTALGKVRNGDQGLHVQRRARVDWHLRQPQDRRARLRPSHLLHARPHRGAQLPRRARGGVAAHAVTRARRRRHGGLVGASPQVAPLHPQALADQQEQGGHCRQRRLPCRSRSKGTGGGDGSSWAGQAKGQGQRWRARAQGPRA